MKKIVIIGVSLILGLGLVAVAVMAQGPGFGRGFGMGPGYGPPGSFPASLTPEHSAKMQSLQQAHLRAIAPLQRFPADCPLKMGRGYGARKGLGKGPPKGLR